MNPHGYWHNLVAAWSTALNATFTGRRVPICASLHRSIETGGWAARVPWPDSWRAHFAYSSAAKCEPVAD